LLAFTCLLLYERYSKNILFVFIYSNLFIRNSCCSLHLPEGIPRHNPRLSRITEEKSTPGHRGHDTSAINVEMEKYDIPSESKIREFQVRRKENKREEFLERKYFTRATEKENWWIALRTTLTIKKSLYGWPFWLKYQLNSPKFHKYNSYKK